MDDGKVMTLADYADKLIEEKNYETLTPELKTELKNELLTQLNDTLLAKLVDHLSDADVKALNTFLDTHPTDEQVQEFIKSKLDNPQSFIANVLISFRKTYLGLEA
jgi:predicted NodU family carbamoyl transferase